MVDKVKYLGMHILATSVETVKAVQEQSRKYINCVGHKAHTGCKSLDISVLAAYAKSLCCFFLPPLIANFMISLEEIRTLWASLGKRFEGVGKHINKNNYLNLTAGGPKGTPALVMRQGLELRTRIAAAKIKPIEKAKKSATKFLTEEYRSKQGGTQWHRILKQT